MPFSLTDKHIVIHYHYVEDPHDGNKGMNACPVSEFEKHIKFLSQHYEPATLQEIFEAGKNNSPKRHYSVTFDDGLKDQYENALPVLKKYGGKATFFIITQTLEGVLPSAHKLHVILSRLPVVTVIDMWNAFLQEKHDELAQVFYIPKDKRIVPNRRLYADISTANIKETFTAVSSNIRDAFLNFVFAQYNLQERELVRSIFLNENRIRDIAGEGFDVGVHTHVHEPIHTLGKKTFSDDFKKSKILMREILGTEPVLFSYPYGFVPEWGSSALLKEGVKHAVTVEERGIISTDDPLLIPRYDMATLRTFLSAR